MYKDIIEIKGSRPSLRHILLANFVYEKINAREYKILKNRYGRIGMVSNLEFKKIKREYLEERCFHALDYFKMISTDKDATTTEIEKIMDYIQEIKKH